MTQFIFVPGSPRYILEDIEHIISRLISYATSCAVCD